MAALKVMIYFKVSLSTHNWDRAFFMGCIPRGVARYPFLRVGKNAVNKPMSGR
ncbi:hypothetical protein WP8S18E02_00510 [Aeromonas hydrophila]|nr:hypothetical protein WP8S18E02_00510 [Aeromonas hydrophila]